MCKVHVLVHTAFPVTHTHTCLLYSGFRSLYCDCLVCKRWNAVILISYPFKGLKIGGKASFGKSSSCSLTHNYHFLVLSERNSALKWQKNILVLCIVMLGAEVLLRSVEKPSIKAGAHTFYDRLCFFVCFLFVSIWASFSFGHHHVSISFVQFVSSTCIYGIPSGSRQRASV